MKQIKLKNKDKYAIVDDEDFDYLNQWTWSYVSKYAARYVKFNGKQTYLYMHRAIMGLAMDDIREVDHKETGFEGYGLDNRRDNLRVCTHSENLRNIKVRKDSTSRYKGVCWYKPLKKWAAYIQIDYARVHIGYFDNIIDAARAYDEAAKKYFGEFASLNFPEYA